MAIIKRCQLLSTFVALTLDNEKTVKILLMLVHYVGV